MRSQRRSDDESARAAAKQEVLRALRLVCASLRQMQRDPLRIRALREVEALLATAQADSRVASVRIPEKRRRGRPIRTRA